jgi:hypothetical protein
VVRVGYLQALFITPTSVACPGARVWTSWTLIILQSARLKAERSVQV